MKYIIHHIGFVVRSIDDVLKDWLDLGFSVRGSKTEEFEIGVECLLLQDSNSMYIELIQPLPGSAALSARINRGGGLDHICYSVNDLENAISFEIANGGVMVLPPLHSALHKTRISFIYRRSGLLIELLDAPVPESS